MRILVDMGHPAHVHFYKNLILDLSRKGHEIKITARNKEVTHALLNAYGLSFFNRGDIQNSMLGKALGLLSIDYAIYRVAREFNPDILLGVHNPYIAHVAKLLGKTSIIFTDTERVGIASRLTFPFSDVIITPACFRDAIDPKKHITFNGYKELAYLHPNTFKPDPGAMERAGIAPGEKFIIIRFISWGASHDVNLHGISPEGTVRFITTLERFGKVLVTSEKTLPGDLEKYRMRIRPEDLHSLLYYAELYIGEGGTMATEAAILGTPAIHIESTKGGVASGSFSGNYNELKYKYGLMDFFPDEKPALEKAVEILSDPRSKTEWQEKRNRLIRDKIDVTAWMLDLIERYPDIAPKKS